MQNIDENNQDIHNKTKISSINDAISNYETSENVNLKESLVANRGDDDDDSNDDNLVPYDEDDAQSCSSSVISGYLKSVISNVSKTYKTEKLRPKTGGSSTKSHSRRDNVSVSSSRLSTYVHEIIDKASKENKSKTLKKKKAVDSTETLDTQMMMPLKPNVNNENSKDIDDKDVDLYIQALIKRIQADINAERRKRRSVERERSKSNCSKEKSKSRDRSSKSPVNEFQRHKSDEDGNDRYKISSGTKSEKKKQEDLKALVLSNSNKTQEDTTKSSKNKKLQVNLPIYDPILKMERFKMDTSKRRHRDHHRRHHRHHDEREHHDNKVKQKLLAKAINERDASIQTSGLFKSEILDDDSNFKSVDAIVQVEASDLKENKPLKTRKNDSNNEMLDRDLTKSNLSSIPTESSEFKRTKLLKARKNEGEHPITAQKNSTNSVTVQVETTDLDKSRPRSKLDAAKIYYDHVDVSRNHKPSQRIDYSIRSHEERIKSCSNKYVIDYNRILKTPDITSEFFDVKSELLIPRVRSASRNTTDTYTELQVTKHSSPSPEREARDSSKGRCSSCLLRLPREAVVYTFDSPELEKKRQYFPLGTILRTPTLNYGVKLDEQKERSLIARLHDQPVRLLRQRKMMENS